MTSKIVVNNIEADAGISSVTVVSNIAGEDSTQNISGINSVTASAFYGDGQNITGSTIRPNFTFDGTDVQVPDKILLNTAGSSIKSNQLRFQSGAAYIDNYSNGQDINFRTSVSSALDTTGPIIKSTGNIAFASGKGIDFSAQTPTSATGASTTAEILDHYEEGSWTPVYLNVNTPTYGHQSGTYTRIGRAVHCQFQISVDSGLDTSDGSAVNIGGLPFTGNSAHESVVFSFGKLTSIMSNARLAEVTNFRFGGTYIMLHRGSNYDINYTLLNSSGHLQAAFTYQMA